MLQSNKQSTSIPISIRERLVCLAASMTLVFTAWSIGGYNDWALHLLFLGGLLTFSFSIAPMPIAWNGYDRRHSFKMNIKRLLRLPFFWLGAVFLVYIFIQYINPSVELVRGEGSWWVQSISPPLGQGFPSSVKADYSEMNALRALVIHGAALMTVWGILVGIQRRKSALIILWAFVLSGTLMGFIAILQKLTAGDPTDPQYILWFLESSNTGLWGTFMYRNQGAAFLILIMAITGVLYFFHIRKSSLFVKESGPHFFCILAILLLYGSVWIALSRAGIILGGIIALIFFTIILRKYFSHAHSSNFRIIVVLATFLVLTSSLFLFELSDKDEINKRINQTKLSMGDIENDYRYLSSKATFDMASDRLFFGWGAGAFRYIFPIYQRNYDLIWYYSKHPTGGWYGRREYKYAHNDWFQLLAEYGLFGISLIGSLFFFLFRYILKNLNQFKAGTVFLLCGFFIICVHNLFDFIFSSPAYLVAFWGSMILVSKLLSLEAKLHKKEV